MARQGKVSAACKWLKHSDQATLMNDLVPIRMTSQLECNECLILQRHQAATWAHANQLLSGNYL